MVYRLYHDGWWYNLQIWFYVATFFYFLTPFCRFLKPSWVTSSGKQKNNFDSRLQNVRLIKSCRTKLLKIYKVHSSWPYYNFTKAGKAKEVPRGLKVATINGWQTFRGHNRWHLVDKRGDISWTLLVTSRGQFYLSEHCSVPG